MKNYVLYGHGGAYNHGAEAIVKVTIEQLRKIENREIVLSTHFKEQDQEFQIDADVFCERDLKYVQMDKQSNVKHLYDKEIYADLISHISTDTVALSVGGDNYCYENWKKWIAVHNVVKERGAKDVLWSCSIEPSMMTDEMIQHLKTFDLITARESFTYEALVERGCENVVLCADVAFLLQEETCKIANALNVNEYVVVNMSPLVMRKETKKRIVIQNVVEVIQDILETTQMKVLLVPHVLMSMDNDVVALTEIKAHFLNDNRVMLVDENLSVAEYKAIIAKCRFGIFARTHASIAAYSNQIPSIVIGYSVKSRGIGYDLGLPEYVIPVEKLSSEMELCLLMRKLIKDEERVKEVLNNRECKSVELALAGVKALERLIKREVYEKLVD